MTPIQAQIDAVFDCVAQWANDEGISLDATSRLSGKLEAALAAAAETAPLTPYGEELIERCAQVAESWRFSNYQTGSGQQQIAAAIRALKDKP